LGSSEAGALAVVPSARGSFDGRYNIRLHQTAPREHCSHAVRGESPVIEYSASVRAQTINVGSFGVQGWRGHLVWMRFATA
jgi:hypothetical protein